MRAVSAGDKRDDGGFSAPHKWELKVPMPGMSLMRTNVAEVVILVVVVVVVVMVVVVVVPSKRPAEGRSITTQSVLKSGTPRRLKSARMSR